MQNTNVFWKKFIYTLGHFFTTLTKNENLHYLERFLEHC